jgi:hypothetical protein
VVIALLKRSPGGGVVEIPWLKSLEIPTPKSTPPHHPRIISTERAVMGDQQR